MKNAFSIVKDFEDAVAEYTGAPYCVAVNSCTNALFLCFKYWRPFALQKFVQVPKHTYVSVPQQIIHAGFSPLFVDLDWSGMYNLYPTPIYDAARIFSNGMYKINTFMCTSHHWNKTLGLQQGGCILHDDPNADIWFRRARFDGRSEGVAPKDDNIQMGYHCYLSPEIAALGLVKLMHLPKHNDPMPMDDYPDLSQMEIFK